MSSIYAFYETDGRYEGKERFCYWDADAEKTYVFTKLPEKGFRRIKKSEMYKLPPKAQEWAWDIMSDLYIEYARLKEKEYNIGREELRI